MTNAARDAIAVCAVFLFFGFCVYMVQTCETPLPASVEQCARTCGGRGVARVNKQGCECK